MLFPAFLTYIVALIAMTATIPVRGAIPRVLVYTATKGYRHDSIPTAIQVLGQQASSYNVSFDFTEDETKFTVDNLSQYDGVMFVSNSDQVLDDDGEAALQTFFQSGGVYTGVHSASACLFNDTTYAQAVGALFDYHPQLQNATFERLNDSFPATAHLPDQWTYEEEVYNFRSDPRTNGAVVVLTVNESSYTNDGSSTGDYPSQGTPHPIAWYIESPLSAQPLASGATKAGRSFYTSLGHLNSTWQDPTFQQHVMMGLTWALEGASTRAYGTGLVGNGTSGSETAGNSSSTQSQSQSSATSGIGGGTGATSSSISATGTSTSSSGAAGKSALLGNSGVGIVGAVVGGVLAGVGLVV
ncbi:trehalose utilization-domain-containing protein [Naematelia encephala]|uniref:Trehalose utilization-domain-containing protein n=1 Tax=Naematelia encephala TaxID=71784 RepID=A0A1Y2BF23_9TREE|nr:trehalose utilization-domain-containing protein [Naematelia encephala]